MDNFNNISDEQLACFIEDNLCEVDCNSILDAVSCDADMDVLSISYHASKLASKDTGASIDIVDLPRWRNGKVAAFMPMPSLYQPMRECAFLGDADMAIDACCNDIEDIDDGMAICANHEEGENDPFFDELEIDNEFKEDK